MEVEIKGIKGTIVNMIGYRNWLNILIAYDVVLETDDHTIIKFENLGLEEIKMCENQSK